MSKEQVKAVLDRVLTWPSERQEDAAKLLMLMESAGRRAGRGSPAADGRSKPQAGFRRRGMRANRAARA